MTDATFDAGVSGVPVRWSASTWMSVVSMAAATFALVSAEFLPAGLLTPMAADLGISEGTAGQVVTATATVGAIAALFANVAIGRLNRKTVLVALSALAVVSNLVAAFATDFWILLLARAGLGIALSGFWSLSAAVVARLVGVSALGRGMSIIFIGVSLATIAAPSIGALISDWIGWRAAMTATAVAAVLAMLLQAVSLPSLPASESNSLFEVFRLTARRGVQLGMLAILLVVTGHFSAFVYVRAYLEQVTVLPASLVALALLGYGVASVVGNVVGGKMADTNVRTALIFTALVLGGAILGLMLLGSSTVPALTLVALWGFGFGTAPIVLQTKVSKEALDALEASGSLVVVCFQVAIALGAVIGGQLVDVQGVASALLFAGIVALLAIPVALGSRRS
ncbi:MFS transporter [Devosia oryziradicis]|uniref:MFS transporter n=1 Tax=Devosia oryziradicis TaxID=2801335 RepID=A0ABX7BYN4_9HYPH|nr:MFS transporter [Devosia oryziradicis]QQR37081.1 MFS transporter [Devosia oryziradicis]